LCPKFVCKFVKECPFAKQGLKYPIGVGGCPLEGHSYGSVFGEESCDAGIPKGHNFVVEGRKYNLRSMKEGLGDVGGGVERSLGCLEGKGSNGIGWGRKSNLSIAQEKAHCEVLAKKQLSIRGSFNLASNTSQVFFQPMNTTPPPLDAFLTILAIH
jgi:hypothetical protein